MAESTESSTESREYLRRAVLKVGNAEEAGLVEGGEGDDGECEDDEEEVDHGDGAEEGVDGGPHRLVPEDPDRHQVPDRAQQTQSHQRGAWNK